MACLVKSVFKAPVPAYCLAQAFALSAQAVRKSKNQLIMIKITTNALNPNYLFQTLSNLASVKEITYRSCKSSQIHLVLQAFVPHAKLLVSGIRIIPMFMYNRFQHIWLRKKKHSPQIICHLAVGGRCFPCTWGPQHSPAQARLQKPLFGLPSAHSPHSPLSPSTAGTVARL